MVGAFDMYGVVARFGAEAFLDELLKLPFGVVLQEEVGSVREDVIDESIEERAGDVEPAVGVEIDGRDESFESVAEV